MTRQQCWDEAEWPLRKFWQSVVGGLPGVLSTCVASQDQVLEMIWGASLTVFPICVSH